MVVMAVVVVRESGHGGIGGVDGDHLHGVVDEAVEDALEEDLDDCARHPARHVAHLLQVLLLGVLRPVLVQLHHPDLLLHQVGLNVVQHLQDVRGVPLTLQRVGH